MGLYNNKKSKDASNEINVYVQNPLKTNVPPPKKILSKTTPDNIYVQNPLKPQIISKPEEVHEPQRKRLLFNVAGLYYHEDALIEAATENKYYDMDDKDLVATGKKKVYAYYFRGDLVFEEEPTNKYSKDAIKILLNDKLIGYVPHDFTLKMKSLIANNSIVKVEYKITGGDYKEIWNGKVEEYESDFKSNVIVTYME